MFSAFFGLDIGDHFNYRCDEEIEGIARKLSEELQIVHFHSRKELENYLLVLPALRKAISRQLRRKGDADEVEIESILDEITTPLKSQVSGNYVGARVDFYRNNSSHKATATLSTEAMNDFDVKWADISKRMEIVPGKQVFSNLNRHLQGMYKINITPAQVIREFNRLIVPKDLARFLKTVENQFCASLVGSSAE